MKEQAVLFGSDKSLVGIVTDPPDERRGIEVPAVILLNAGIVHRVGPNRMYVKMARHLSAMGFVVMRFDFSGIGDSQPRRDNLPFVKSAISEVQEAMDCLQQMRGARRFVLIGGCSGARVSFHAACHDPRVVGAFLANYNRGATNGNEHTNSQVTGPSIANYYWKFALFNPQSWKKFFGGRANYIRIAKALEFQVRRRFTRRETTPESIQFAANLRLLAERRVRICFVWSEGDPGVYELAERGGKDLAEFGEIAFHVIPKTDHTFSSLHDQQHLLGALGKWAVELLAGAREAVNRSQKEPQLKGDCHPVAENPFTTVTHDQHPVPRMPQHFSGAVAQD